MIFSALTDYARTDFGVFQYRDIKELLDLKKHGDRVFYRDFFPGHFTGSALIADMKLERVLLTYHRKLEKWLQLGGHADGDQKIWQVALREAHEESGLKEVFFYNRENLSAYPPEILDVDAHWIPENKKEQGHYHYDIRYLLVTPTPHAIQISEESSALEWFSLEKAYEVTEEKSLRRLFDKMKQIRGR